MASTVLDCFPKLLRDNVNERLNAGIKLVQQLSKETQENGESKEFNHSLNRLIRGLGSPKVTPRKGFYSTFTVYLTLNPDTKVDKIFSIMDHELKLSASSSKSECGDVCNGRILACGALIRSNILKNSSLDEQKRVLECLIHNGKQKSYLNFEAMTFIIEFLKKIDQSEFSLVWPILEPEILKPFSEQTLDTFYVLLIILDKFSEVINKDSLIKCFGTDNIICEKSIQDISKILTDIPRVICYKHPVHELFCQKLVDTGSIEMINQFWTGLDENFIKPSKTDKHLGVELFHTVLQKITVKIANIVDTSSLNEDCTNKKKKELVKKILKEKNKYKSVIPSLLSTNFLKFIIKRVQNNPNKKDEIANSFRMALTQLITLLDKQIESEALISLLDIGDVERDKDEESSLRFSILKRLILHPGNLMIQKLTGTKVLEMLTNKLGAKDIKELSELFREIAANTKFKEIPYSEPESWNNEERIYAIQFFSVKLVNHPTIICDEEWRLEQLKFLFQLGLCEVYNNDDLLPHFKESFYRALDHKLPKLDDLRSILNSLITYIDESVFQNSKLKLKKPLDEDNEEPKEAWQKMLELNKILIENSKQWAKICAVFHTMSLHMGLQLFSEPEMATDAIKDLYICFERLKDQNKKGKKKKSKEDKKTKGADAEDEPEWVEVVVDLLLVLLSRKSHLLRSLVGVVFRHICPYLNSDAIHNILSKLDPSTNPLSEDLGTKSNDDEEKSEDDTELDEDDDEDDDESDDDENDDDTEENTSEATEETIEQESDSDVEQSDDEDETMTDRVRMAVQQALGSAALQSDVEDVDIDDIDDEEGKRLDEKLAAAFKILKQARKSRSKKQDGGAQMLTHFRIRVIDLLEIYLESTPSMALALDMLVPLFMLLEFCIKDPHQKPLENRVRSCLKKLAAIKKFDNVQGVEEEVLMTVLKLLIEKGERSASVCQIMGDKLAECCAFLIRCSQQANIPTDSFIQIFEENLTAFFEKRNCILPAILFKRLLQLCWTGTWHLATLLVKFAFAENIRSYRRGQALEFLKVFYSNSKMINSEEHRNSRLKLEKKLYKESTKVFKTNASETENSELNSDVQATENNAVSNVGKEIKQKYIHHLLVLLFTINSCHIPEAWNWEELHNQMSNYRSNLSLSKEAKVSYNKLARRLGAPVANPKPKKIKTELSNGSSKLEEETVNEALNGESNILDSLSNKKDKKRKKHKNKDKQNINESNLSNGINDVSIQNGHNTSEEMETEVVGVKRSSPSPNTPDVPSKKKKKISAQSGE